MIPVKRLWFKMIMLSALAMYGGAAGAQLKADFSATPVMGCAPVIVDFRDISTGNPTSWLWDLGNGAITDKQHPRTTYFNPGTYPVKLVVRTANGVDSIVKTKFIVVNAAPTVDFMASDSTGCFPLKVSFKEFSTAGSGTIKSFEWDFGDGALSSEQTPTHTYINSGNFTVTLRVYNSNGCVKVYTKPAYIKLQDGVKADFSYMSAAGCLPPTPVTFTNKSTGTSALTYKWSFGDGATSTLKDPVHNYTAPGAYTIRLIVTNTSGCSDTISKANAINIGFVKADFSRPDTVCQGASFVLQNNSTPNTVASTWYFSDGTTSSAINPIKTFNAPGTYNIKLVNDFGSCKDSITKSITIKGKPTGNFTSGSNGGCTVPFTVTFQSNSATAISYFWDFGDGNSSTQKNPSNVYTKLGTYTVKLITANSLGCSDTLTKVDFVKIEKPLILSVTGLPDRGCIPYTVYPKVVVQSAQAISSYFWDFGDGFTSTAVNPSHTYTISGRYNVKVIVTTSAGCADTLNLTGAVAVGTRPVVDFSATPRISCAENSISFTDLSPGINYEWFWEFGDGGTSILQNPGYNYMDTGKFSVTLFVTNLGCTDSLKKKDYIQIVPPIAKFDTAFFCTNRLTRKFINKSVGATSWFWQFGDGTTSTQQDPPAHTYAGPGVYTVVLRVTNGTCEHSAKMYVNVIKEQGKFVVGDSSACRFSRVIMDVQNIKLSNISNFTWYFNGLNGPAVVTNNTPVAQTYRDAGVYNVAVILNDVFGCKDTLKGIIPVKIYGPKVNFFPPSPGTCFATTVNFIDSTKTDGTNAIKQWFWDYGDGAKQTYTVPPFTHKYDSTGVFDVTLKIIDAYGCKDSITKKAVITITKPIASYTISDTVICPKTPLVVTNASTGLEVKYSWDFGDGYTTDQYNPTHIYTVEGNYRIIMRMVDKFGCTDSMSYNIKVFEAVSSFLMSDSFSSCPPLKVNFTNQSRNFTSFSWDFGDGGFSNLQNPQHIYIYPGDYLVKLWVKNNGGCSDTLRKTVSIQGPSGVFNYGPKVVCNPSDVNFTATTKNTVKYIWDFNDGSTIFTDQKMATHTYTRPGSYVPKMILEDASGCRVPIVGKDTITVNYIDTKIAAETRMVCDSGFVVFTDTTTTNDAIGTFMWNFGDGNTSSDRNPIHKYKDTGWYTVKLVATSAFGCTDTAIIQNFIKVVNSPLVSIVGDTSACVPSTLNFTAAFLRSDTSSVRWNWNFGNGQASTLQNPPKQNYDTAGNYPISVQVINSDGCISNVARTVNIHPNPVVDAGPNLIACRNTPVTLTPSGADAYVWDPQPSLSCTNCATPAATPAGRTVYRVTGSTIYGCTNVDTVAVDIQQPFKITVNKGDTLCQGSSFQLNAFGADKYQWSPALFLDSTTLASPIARPDSTITYSVIGRDNNNCFADTGTVTLSIRPIDIFIDGLTSACEPANLTFKGSISNNDTSTVTWRWDFGNGVISNTQNPSAQSYLKAGSYPVKLVVSTSSGCSGSKETVAQINPIPTVQAGPDTTVCRFTPLNLQATGANTYTWNAQPSLSCTNCATPVANPIAKTTYIVNGSTVYGCTNSDTITVDVQQPFTMTVNKGDTLCQGSIFQLNASGADKYQWSPALYLDSATLASPVARPDSTITYTVIGRDKNNCFADTGSVTLNIRPIDITINGITTACEPANLTFKGNILYSDTSTVSWSWDFGNGVISNAQNPSAQNYLKAGSYPVKLVVSTSRGCSGSKETVAQINPTPTVQVGPDTTVCRFTPLSLKATGADNYTWNAQPSLSCVDCATPVANPTTKTTYTVTGKTLFGCENRDTITVDVQQPFIMDVIKGDSLCQGSSFKLNASGADKYQWSPALYLDSTTLASPIARPDSTITYRVIGRDKNNCFADTGNVTLRVRAIDILINGITSACEPANLTFKGSILNSDTSNVSWRWDFGNGVISTAQNPSAQNYLKAGSYPVKVMVSTSSGCTGSKETMAQINPVPTVNVGPDAIICKAAPLTLKAIGADTYTWDFKPSLNCLNCPSPVAKPDSTMMYAVTGRTAFGCSSRDSLLVTVNQPFKMTVGLGDTLCLGESSILVAKGAQTYQWTPTTWLDNPQAGTTKANPQNSIAYQVIGKDSIGCFADTGRITLQVYPKPKIDILAGAAINLNVGSKVTLDTKNSPDITKWVWTPALGLTCINCPNPVATPKETTTYTVSAANNGGCSTSDDIIITVICNDVNIYIPNTFSPNDDGVNDYFFPRSSSVFTVKTFRVFNRWGQLVYQKNNFNSNSAEEGWDGKMNGQKLTPDVYVYSIEILCGNGSTIPVKGNVSLIK